MRAIRPPAVLQPVAEPPILYGLAILSKVVPGETTAREAHARVLYSAVSDRSETRSRHYVLQRGDLFYSGADAGGSYMDFDIDTKTYAYILRDGETEVPGFIQEVYDLAIAGQWIMRPHMRVGMTAGESLSLFSHPTSVARIATRSAADGRGCRRRLLACSRQRARSAALSP